MTKIGNKEVAYATTVLLLDEEEGEISFAIENWTFNMRFSFHPDAGDQQVTESEVQKDAIKLIFKGWKNELGSGFTKPIALAKSPSGRPIEWLMYHDRVGTLNRADMQFTLGEKA